MRSQGRVLCLHISVHQPEPSPAQGTGVRNACNMALISLEGATRKGARPVIIKDNLLGEYQGEEKL